MIVSGLVLVDTPEAPISIDRSNVTIANSVAHDVDGPARLTGNGSPSRLIWTEERNVPGFVSPGTTNSVP